MIRTTAFTDLFDSLEPLRLRTRRRHPVHAYRKLDVHTCKDALHVLREVGAME